MLGPTAASRLLPPLILIFFLSGATGLIYQVLWLRMLGLVFGVTVYAASTVWASFMAGLALGSVLGGRLGDRVSRPLAWFGAAEALVGLTALATPWGLAGIGNLYAAMVPGLEASTASLTAVRAATAFAVLLVPTLLMGATLPLIVQSTLFRADHLGPRVGLLYGVNTTGAIVGTLAAGLVLIPTAGIQATLRFAALVNITGGAVALWLGLGSDGRLPVAAAPVPVGEGPATGETPADDAPPPAALPTILAVFFVSGLATLALEVIWFRVIVLLARPTVYTFAALLATVLLGIAAGSYVVTPLLTRRWPWLGVLAGLEVLMAVTAVLSLNAVGVVDALARGLGPWLTWLLPGYFVYPVAAAVPAILPTSVLMGMAFPIGLMLWSRGATAGGRAASRIGTFYSVNLSGAILGSLAAGFVLLPAWGSRGSLVAVSAALLLSGLALIAVTAGPAGRRVAAMAASVAVFAVAAASAVDPLQAFLGRRYPRQPMVWREEAVQGTVSVHAFGRDRSLMLDGNHQASNTGPMVTVHRRIGHLGLAIHREARDVLVVGLGGGATAGAAALHEGVQVDVVELSAAVVRAAAFFRDGSGDVLNRPNVRLRIDDARHHLRHSGRRYDLITADLILPIHAGANNVYSREYFELVRRALKPGGMAVQWAAGTDAEYGAIVRTFLSVFPYATAWGDGTLLVGTLEPLRLREADFDWKRLVPGRREALDSIGMHSFADLTAQFAAGPEELAEFIGRGPMLTDDRPLTEYFLSLPREFELDLNYLKGDVSRYIVD